MNENCILTKLAFLTPSRVFNSQRYNFSSDSITSLHKSLMGRLITHIIVHDKPKQFKCVPAKMITFLNSYKWSKKTEDMYHSLGVTFIEGSHEGSAAALLLSVNHALSLNKTYGFIHLDDHIYCSPFLELLENGLDAMERNNNLIWTRYSGYPIIHDGKKTQTISANDKICFDNVELSSLRMEHYTLWSSPIKSEVNQGNYWPVAMWFCIYRLSVLKIMLEWAIAANKRHLAHVEVFYKENDGFNKLINTYPEGSFGYINMQFGGFEMHRNHNWQELLLMDNHKII